MIRLLLRAGTFHVTKYTFPKRAPLKARLQLIKKTDRSACSPLQATDSSSLPNNCLICFFPYQLHCAKSLAPATQWQSSWHLRSETSAAPAPSSHAPQSSHPLPIYLRVPPPMPEQGTAVNLARKRFDGDREINWPDLLNSSHGKKGPPPAISRWPLPVLKENS